jgi:putative oxidoreductase
MTNSSIGPMLNRIGLGLVLVFHSVYLKGFVFGLTGTAAYFGSIGLPPFTAYLVFIIEALAGRALITGDRVRLAAVSSVPILLGATWAHSGNGWLFSNSGGGWEYPVFLAIIALGVAFQDADRFALDSRSRELRLQGVSS